MVGLEVEGDSEGFFVGWLVLGVTVVGARVVGFLDGVWVGFPVGLVEGFFVVGLSVGAEVGRRVEGLEDRRWRMVPVASLLSATSTIRVTTTVSLCSWRESFRDRNLMNVVVSPA